MNAYNVTFYVPASKKHKVAYEARCLLDARSLADATKQAESKARTHGMTLLKVSLAYKHP